MEVRWHGNAGSFCLYLHVFSSTFPSAAPRQACAQNSLMRSFKMFYYNTNWQRGEATTPPPQRQPTAPPQRWRGYDLPWCMIHTCTKRTNIITNTSAQSGVLKGRWFTTWDYFINLITHLQSFPSQENREKSAAYVLFAEAANLVLFYWAEKICCFILRVAWRVP